MEFNATFIVSIISFVLFVLVMNKVFYAPISNIIIERENVLKQNFDEAQELDNSTNTLLKDRDKRLNEAELNSREIIAKKIEEFNNLSKKAINEANQKAKDEIQEQKDILLEENRNAELELKSKEKELAQVISSKILGFDVNFDDENAIAKEGTYE